MLVESCESEHPVKPSNGPLTNRTMGEVEGECSIKIRARHGENNITHDIMMSGRRLVCQSHALRRHMYRFLLSVSMRVGLLTGGSRLGVAIRAK